MIIFTRWITRVTRCRLRDVRQNGRQNDRQSYEMNTITRCIRLRSVVFTSCHLFYEMSPVLRDVTLFTRCHPFYEMSFYELRLQLRGDYYEMIDQMFDKKIDKRSTMLRDDACYEMIEKTTDIITISTASYEMNDRVYEMNQMSFFRDDQYWNKV